MIHNAPNARIIFDKFHIMRHLSKALDEVRRGEYKRLSGKDRSYIKGQRYTLRVYADSCGLKTAFLGNGGRNAATIFSLRYSSSG